MSPTPEALPGYGEPVAWHTATTIAADWPDAEDVPAALLNDLLNVARAAVEEFAPVLPAEMVEDGLCPASYRLAHFMQTRNLWNAVEVTPGGDFGDDTYSMRPVPLDWIVKQLLRPKRAVPVAL